MSQFHRILAASSAIFLLTAGPSFGESVNLAWDHNSEPDIAGYHVLLGVASGQYTQTIDAGPATTATIPDLAAGTNYFFAVTAYNTSGFESLPSSELSYSVPGGPAHANPNPRLQHQSQPLRRCHHRLERSIAQSIWVGRHWLLMETTGRLIHQPHPISVLTAGRPAIRRSPLVPRWTQPTRR